MGLQLVWAVLVVFTMLAGSLAAPLQGTLTNAEDAIATESQGSSSVALADFGPVSPGNVIGATSDVVADTLPGAAVPGGIVCCDVPSSISSQYKPYITVDTSVVFSNFQVVDDDIQTCSTTSAQAGLSTSVCFLESRTCDSSDPNWAEFGELGDPDSDVQDGIDYEIDRVPATGPCFVEVDPCDSGTPTVVDWSDWELKGGGSIEVDNLPTTDGCGIPDPCSMITFSAGVGCPPGPIDLCDVHVNGDSVCDGIDPCDGKLVAQHIVCNPPEPCDAAPVNAPPCGPVDPVDPCDGKSAGQNVICDPPEPCDLAPLSAPPCGPVDPVDPCDGKWAGQNVVCNPPELCDVAPDTVPPCGSVDPCEGKGSGQNILCDPPERCDVLPRGVPPCGEVDVDNLCERTGLTVPPCTPVPPIRVCEEGAPDCVLPEGCDNPFGDTCPLHEVCQVNYQVCQPRSSPMSAGDLLRQCQEGDASLLCLTGAPIEGLGSPISTCPGQFTEGPLPVICFESTQSKDSTFATACPVDARFTDLDTTILCFFEDDLADDVRILLSMSPRAQAAASGSGNTVLKGYLMVPAPDANSISSSDWVPCRYCLFEIWDKDGSMGGDDDGRGTATTGADGWFYKSVSNKDCWSCDGIDPYFIVYTDNNPEGKATTDPSFPVVNQNAAFYEVNSGKLEQDCSSTCDIDNQNGDEVRLGALLGRDRHRTAFWIWDGIVNSWAYLESQTGFEAPRILTAYPLEETSATLNDHFADAFNAKYVCGADPCSAGEYMGVGSEVANDKMVVAHEYGHYIHSQVVDAATSGSWLVMLQTEFDCPTENDPSPYPSSEGHMYPFVSGRNCGYVEGFAHLFAHATFGRQHFTFSFPEIVSCSTAQPTHYAQCTYELTQPTYRVVDDTCTPAADCSETTTFFNGNSKRFDAWSDGNCVEGLVARTLWGAMGVGTGFPDVWATIGYELSGVPPVEYAEFHTAWVNQGKSASDLNGIESASRTDTSC